MKKLLLSSAMMLLSLTAISQVKKIAILETIDRSGTVSYSIKLMVRSNLTKTISNTPGYEGYDRVNMSQIVGEQDFQRTGMVNEEQIKKLGEITGADYIVVSEAAKVDESNIFVTAVILNVETAQTVGADNALMATTASDIQHGCESLANRLLGLPDNTSSATSAPAKQTPMKEENIKQDNPVPVPLPVVAKHKIGDLITFPDGTQGLIFYLEDGKGLAMSMKEEEMKWDKNRKNKNKIDVSNLSNFKYEDLQFSYGQGLMNTQIIVQSLGESAEAAIYCVQQGEGWYLPSSSELRCLLNTARNVPQFVNALKARKIKIYGWYWSSDEYNNEEAVNVCDDGVVDHDDKRTNNEVRAIRAFSE